MREIMRKKTLIIIGFILLIIFSYTTNTYATTIDPDKYKPGDIQSTEVQDVIQASSIIVDVIRTVGIIVAVVVLLVLGIKYMVGSVEERAEYKKTMIPYLVGAFLFFGLSQILAVIIEAAKILEN